MTSGFDRAQDAYDRMLPPEYPILDEDDWDEDGWDEDDWDEDDLADRERDRAGDR